MNLYGCSRNSWQNYNEIVNSGASRKRAIKVKNVVKVKVKRKINSYVTQCWAGNLPS